MAVSEAFAGTETITGTEWSLTTDTSGPDAETSDGVFETWIDLSAMARGDAYQIKAYEKVESAGTQRAVYSDMFFNQQTDPMTVLPPLMLMHGWDFTLKKIAGTDRAITWGIRARGVTPTEDSTASTSITNTEFFLKSNSTTKTAQGGDGTYQLFLDLNNLVKSDLFELKIYERARAADATEQVAFRAQLAGLRTLKHYVTPALTLMNGWEFSLVRKSASSRTIPHSLRKVA